MEQNIWLAAHRFSFWYWKLGGTVKKLPCRKQGNCSSFKKETLFWRICLLCHFVNVNLPCKYHILLFPAKQLSRKCHLISILDFYWDLRANVWLHKTSKGHHDPDSTVEELWQKWSEDQTDTKLESSRFWCFPKSLYLRAMEKFKSP